MEWILTLAETFSLSQILTRSHHLMLAPFEVQASQEILTRVERLSSGHTVTLSLYHSPEGLHLQTRERLTATEAEEVTCKTWRMLRLGENLLPFVNQAAHDPLWGPEIQRAGARFLRGATLFEDLSKALILGYTSPNWGPAHIAWLIAQIGDPLPSNPTRHAFPTPHQILKHQAILSKALGETLGKALGQAAEFFQARGNEVEILANPRIPLELVLRTFNQIPLLNSQALAITMLNLGRYDYIPAAALNSQAPDFESWQPWGGLIYWIWTTSPLSIPQHEGELHHG